MARLVHTGEDNAIGSGVNLAGEKQGGNGKLTALYPVGRDANGYIWMCRCECGRTREVLAKRFRRLEVRSCLDCRVRPVRTQRHFDDGWYTTEFRAAWRAKVEAMPYERRLLMEIYLVDRTECWQYEMQAADIALREVNPVAEIQTHTAERVEKAVRVLADKGILPPRR